MEVFGEEYIHVFDLFESKPPQGRFYLIRKKSPFETALKTKIGEVDGKKFIYHGFFNSYSSLEADGYCFISKEGLVESLKKLESQTKITRGLGKFMESSDS